MRDIEEIVSIAIDCGFHLHKELGPGVLESVYIRLAKQPVGLLMNFGGETFRDGLRRIVNGAIERAPA